MYNVYKQGTGKNNHNNTYTYIWIQITSCVGVTLFLSHGYIDEIGRASCRERV